MAGEAKEPTARELAQREVQITDSMIEASLYALRELRATVKPKGMSLRELMHEVLRAALIIKVGVAGLDAIVKDEKDWGEFFRNCQVFVRNDKVGMDLLREATDGKMATFRQLVESIGIYKEVVVPLLLYPGVKLFAEAYEEKPKEEATKKTDAETATS